MLKTITMGDWDTYSKLNVGHDILGGCSFGCLWLRKLAKEMAKSLESQNGIFGTFIYENSGN